MKKVLIIDDDFDLATLLVIVLNIRGYEVEALQDFTLVFKVIKKFRPDIILMDYYIKQSINGEELCIKIKEKFHIPVLLFSAAEPKKICADDFLKKPFEIDKFLGKINKLINGR